MKHRMLSHFVDAITLIILPLLLTNGINGLKTMRGIEYSKGNEWNDITFSMNQSSDEVLTWEWVHMKTENSSGKAICQMSSRKIEVNPDYIDKVRSCNGTHLLLKNLTLNDTGYYQKRELNVRSSMDSDMIFLNISECGIGMYGYICDKPCPSSNCTDNKCDRYTGLCSLGCKDGNYGNFCNSSCQSSCVRCDRSTSLCLGCKNSFFGNFCESQCSRNCMSNINGIVTCEQTSGRCLSGCKPYYYGEQCDKACMRCMNGTCNMTTGVCNVGCQGGWNGPLCIDQCSSTCGNITGAPECDRGTAVCLNGCNAGFYGDKCQNQCNANCVNRLCYANNGTCSAGCRSGYFGDMCNNVCLQPCADNTCDRRTGLCPDCGLIQSPNCPTGETQKETSTTLSEARKEISTTVSETQKESSTTLSGVNKDLLWIFLVIIVIIVIIVVSVFQIKFWITKTVLRELSQMYPSLLKTKHGPKSVELSDADTKECLPLLSKNGVPERSDGEVYTDPPRATGYENVQKDKQKFNAAYEETKNMHMNKDLHANLMVMDKNGIVYNDP